MPVFDLHCDTLTAFMSPLRCQDTLDDPCSAFALSKVQTIPWCQCCAVFVPATRWRPCCKIKRDKKGICPGQIPFSYWLMSSSSSGPMWPLAAITLLGPSRVRGVPSAVVIMPPASRTRSIPAPKSQGFRPPST